MISVPRQGRTFAGAVVATLVAARLVSAQTPAPHHDTGSKQLATGAPPAAAAALLAGRALGETPVFDDLRELCDHIGGRPTGSPACERAVEWGEAKFRSAGLERVTTEKFTLPSLWLGDSAEAACLTPESFPIRVAASPGTPSTPGGKPLEARLLVAGEGTPADFQALGSTAHGAIALVRTREMKTFDDLFAEYMRDRPMLEAAAKAQVAAVLLMSTRPRDLLYRHPVSINGVPAPLPVAVIAREPALRLARLAAESGGRAEVRMRLATSNRVGPAYESRNVIAEIRGREKPQEVVLLGAHLDSWDLGTGEEDNGVNVALVIDVARGFQALGFVPRRTVRFVLFTGEEQGLFGSAGYVKQHANELGDHVAVVIYDTGSGRTNGFYLNGREEMRAPVERALAAVAGLGEFEHPIDGIDGTDNFDFLLSGVPNLVAAQDPPPYLPDYHAESDVFERVDTRQAKANVAIASALVWSLAESPERPAPRQSRAEVEKLLAATHLDAQMQAFGQWEDWVAGRRGVGR